MSLHELKITLIWAYQKNRTQDPERAQDPWPYGYTGPYQDPGSYEDPWPYEEPESYEDLQFYAEYIWNFLGFTENLDLKWKFNVAFWLFSTR